MRRAKYTPVKEPIEYRALRVWYSIKNREFIQNAVIRFVEVTLRITKWSKERKLARARRDREVKESIYNHLKRELW